MVRYALAALSFVAILIALAHAEVPSYIQICGRKNPQLDKCVEESVGKLTSKLKVGIPELDVPPLEPMEVEELPLADLPEFKAIAYNVKISGLSNYMIKYLRVDLEKQKIDIEVFFPKIILDSDYEVRAKILVPINEKGPISTETENVSAKVSIKFQTVERRGRKLMYFPSMTSKLTIKTYKAKYMPGAEMTPIAQAINSVLQNSQQEIIESMLPHLEKAISTKVLDVSNRICKHFTYDELFPDRP